MVFGVNPNEASTAGRQAATEAGEFTRVAGDFSDILERCETAAGDTGAGQGFTDFNGYWKKALLEVERHGRQTGDNTAGVAGESTNTDLDITGRYGSGTAGLPQVGDIVRPIN